jgi:hypothetical protein
MTTTKRIALSILVFLLAAGFTGCALEDEPLNDTESAISGRPYPQVWESASGKYYFRFKAANHQIILSSEDYSTRTGALNGVLSVLDNAGNPDRYDIKQANNGDFYFNLKAGNGHIIGSSELYVSRSNAERGAETVERNVGEYLGFLASRTGARFQVSESSDGRYHFNLHAANGEIVLSSQSYSTEASAFNGTFSVADSGLDIDNYDINQTSSANGYYFNLKASNGKIIGTSEVYSTKSNAKRAAESITELLPKVELL